MDRRELQQEIRGLLREREAVLLVHYYQREEIQEIADILGDSLGLSIKASQTDARVIVFAGVHFMAESASILSPEKTVLLPRTDAGCPLADFITPEELRDARREHPRAAVVTYVNSTAAVKALSDVCCTSANAVRVVQSLAGAEEILMVPDGNLARYVAKQTGKRIIPWEGYCPVHHALLPEDIRQVRSRHPDAPFMAHPECRPEVLDMADFVGSTADMLSFARTSPAGSIIVGTEEGLLTRLKKESPGKAFHMASPHLLCETMKYTTLEDVHRCLREMGPVVAVPEEIRIPAKAALTRMLRQR